MSVGARRHWLMRVVTSCVVVVVVFAATAEEALLVPLAAAPAVLAELLVLFEAKPALAGSVAEGEVFSDVDPVADIELFAFGSLLARPLEAADPVLLVAAPVVELVVADVSLLANPALVEDEVLLAAEGGVALVELAPACAVWLEFSLFAMAEDGAVLVVVLELLFARPAFESVFAVSALVEDDDALAPAALLLWSLLATVELPVAVEAALVDDGAVFAEPEMLALILVLLLLAKFELLLEDGVLADAVLFPADEVFSGLLPLALAEPFMLLEPFEPEAAFALMFVFEL